jgi:translation elongation factor P/translation initiation factor 5A
MKKKAEELKVGEKILLGEEILKIEEIELSDVGKQGIKKCRIVASKLNGEMIIIIRPSNYPFNIQ